jgi:hypothetical protein
MSIVAAFKPLATGLAIGLILSVAAGCAHVGLPTSQVPSTATPLFQGVSYWRAPAVVDRPQIIHVLAVDLKKAGTRLMATPGDRSGGLEYRAQTVSAFLAQQNLKAAINGGYFLPFKGGSPGGEDYYPKAGDGANVSGAAWGGGKQASPVETDPTDTLNYDARVVGIVCIDDGVKVAILDGQVCPIGVEDALSAGPRLLKDGKPSLSDAKTPPAAGDRTPGAPRTSIGVSKDGRFVWLVVVDGRQAGVSEGASIEELKTLFLSLGAYDALNLDGGGSSTMVVAGPQAPRVLSSPIHTGVPGRERPSANHLGVFAKALPK